MIIVTGQCAMLCGALACMVLLVRRTPHVEPSRAQPAELKFVIKVIDECNSFLVGQGLYESKKQGKF